MLHGENCSRVLMLSSLGWLWKCWDLRQLSQGATETCRVSASCKRERHTLDLKALPLNSAPHAQGLIICIYSLFSYNCYKSCMKLRIVMFPFVGYSWACHWLVIMVKGERWRSCTQQMLPSKDDHLSPSPFLGWFRGERRWATSFSLNATVLGFYQINHVSTEVTTVLPLSVGWGRDQLSILVVD